MCHAVYRRSLGFVVAQGHWKCPELLDFGLSGDCYVLVMEAVLYDITELAL